MRGPARSPTTTSPPSHSSPPDNSLSIPPTYGKRASAGYPEKYEMQTYDERVYGPGSERISQTSQSSSFATADDFWTGEEGVGSPDYAHQHKQMLHMPPPQPDLFDAQSSRPHVASQADEDDRSTIVADSPRGSVSLSWEGGRAV
jgi:hypothetical protein